jgi:Lecithin:cholesterol acyltransferase
MKKVLYLVLAIHLVTCGLHQSAAQSDQFEKELSLLQAEINQQYELASELKPLASQRLGATSPNICTNGKSPSQLSPKDYIREFTNGPCTPLIVLAGITGTKLQIQVDCPTLQANHPKLFSNCKWTSCDAKTTSSLVTVPKPEYTLWIPDLVSPFSLANPSEEAHQCLVGLFGINHIREQNKVAIEEVRGLKVIPMGMTTHSAGSSKCGFEAISNLLPVASFLQPTKYKGFDKMRTTLESMGYKTGLTLQPLPYDWRKSFLNNEVSQKLEKMIDVMYAIVGKKVSIAAHSFGNMNVLNVFNRMSQQKKDQKVRRYFSLGAPFLGSPTTFGLMIGGDSRYNFEGVGITFWILKKTMATFPATFDLMPRTTWALFKDQVWLKAAENRILREAGKPPLHSLTTEDDIVSKIYPSETSVCFANDWTSRNNLCLSGMKEFLSIGSINGEEVHVNNIQEILHKYSYNDNAGLLYDSDNKRAEYDQMTNPGVESVHIFSNILVTPLNYVWHKDPKILTMHDHSDFLVADKITYSIGDKSVLASSTLVPAFKWAHEFDSRQPGAKPVILAEVCSTFNRKTAVFQSDAAAIIKNEYQGISCKCKKGSESGCDHLGMISDQDVVDYIANSLLDKQQPSIVSKYFDDKSDDAVRDFIKRCGIINDDSF